MVPAMVAMDKWTWAENAGIYHPKKQKNTYRISLGKYVLLN